MKILWFTNGPGVATEYLTGKQDARSWYSCLNREIVKDFDLSVAFYYPKYSEPFCFQDTKFYPICKKNWKFEMVKNMLFETFVDEEDLDNYLNIIEKVKPDLIHIHGTENPFGCIISHTKIPVVISMQGIPTAIELKYLAGLPSEYLKTGKTNFGIKDLMNGKRFKKGFRGMRLMAAREQKNLNHCRYIIGRTEWDRRVTSVLAPQSTYFGNDHRILDDIYYDSNWAYPDDTNGFVVHTTISNNYYKGFETICLALYHLRKIGFNVKIQVAGITEKDEIYLAVKKYLKYKFPTSNLMLLGKLNSEQIVKELNNAHIYLMASHIENNSNSLCEAMLVGMPCISSFVGGIGSLITDNYDGILVQNGDAYVLAGAIKELCLNKEKSLMLAQNAKKTAMERHNKENIVRNILNVYKQIIYKL